MNWVLIAAFMQLKGTQTIKWKPNCLKAYKYWRYVVVDHSGKKCQFSSIEWYIKSNTLCPNLNHPNDTSDEDVVDSATRLNTRANGAIQILPHGTVNIGIVAQLQR